MANLVSPGISVSVTDESFFIPAAATTVPLIFVATADHKLQPDGLTPATGTYESDKVETITSVTQSLQLYGVPKFLQDQSGNQYHGDSRNEYGLLALNQFLGVGNLAYVVRANVNLDDDITSVRNLWNGEVADAQTNLELLIDQYIQDYNNSNGYTSTTPGTQGYQVVGLKNGSQEVDTGGGHVGGDATGLAADTAGYQIVNTGGSHVGGDATGLSNDATTYQIVNTGGSHVGGDATGLSNDATTYQATITVDGTPYSIMIPGNLNQTYTALLGSINTALGGAGTADITTGNIRVTSATTGTSSSVSIVDMGANLLFASLTGYVAKLASVAGTTTNYTTTITVDGSSYTVTANGETNQTYTDLLATLTAGVGAAATVALNGGGNIQVTSASTGTSSTVSIVDSGANHLFASMTGFVAINTAVVGGVAYGDDTGLAPTTTYTATITIDSTANPVSITTGAGTTTYNDVINSINTQITGALASLVNGNIQVTSLTTGTTSTIDISDVDLFSTMTDFVAVNSAVDGTASPFKLTVTGSELIALATQAMAPVFDLFSFSTLENTFFTDVTANPYPVYANGYNYIATGIYNGFNGNVSAWNSGSVVTDEFTSSEGGDMLVSSADDFQYIIPFRDQTSLGSNDASRRTKIVTALAESINSNSEVRSENYQFNLVLCPGYPEVVVDLLTLVQDINDEAFVIADTPMNQDPSTTVTWALTTARRSSTQVAYYYPHSLVSNINGINVVGAASGTALATYAYSDNVSNVWFPPAGTNRGLVTGAIDIGYVTGQLGGATTFVATHLNQGQRDSLYQYYTNINPIVFFPGRGIIVWGQKTSDPAAESLDRVNVSRLMCYIRRQLRTSMLPFVFELNTVLTRKNVTAVVGGFLGNLVNQQALYDFAVLCDTSNNTPTIIDQNELIVDIALQPTKAIEFVYIPIRIVATGASL